MARKRSTHTVYRDSLTGRFVSPLKWKRSHAQGGKRYKRERIRTVHRKTTQSSSILGVAAIPTGVETGKVPISTGSHVVLTPVDIVPQDEEFFESGFEADEEDEY
jgi:hypothetical protein